MHCPHCGHALKNIAGLGFQPRYICNNAHCPSNQLRHLRCPNPSCGGAALKEAKIGLGHQLYECPTCGFAFDTLGQVAAPVCSTCNRPARVQPNANRGFDIVCPGCSQSLSVNP